MPKSQDQLDREVRRRVIPLEIAANEKRIRQLDEEIRDRMNMKGNIQRRNQELQDKLKLDAEETL